jgi:hypothetical protein
MFPESVDCNRCGRRAVVVAATPIYDDADKLRKSDGADNANEYSCRVDCPQCGVRIQAVRVHSE